MIPYSRILNEEEMKEFLKTDEVDKLLGLHVLAKSSNKKEYTILSRIEKVVLNMTLKHLEFSRKNPKEIDKIQQGKESIEAVEEVSKRMQLLIQQIERQQTQVLDCEAEKLQMAWKINQLLKEVEKQKQIINL